MISKLGVILLIKIRDYPDYFMPLDKLKIHEALIWHLASHGYLVFGHRWDIQGLGMRITIKGAETIAENMQWLIKRGFKA